MRGVGRPPGASTFPNAVAGLLCVGNGMPSRPPIHRPKRAPARDGRPSAARRGYDSDWRKLRLVVLDEEPVCRSCGREASEHVDHIVALAKGGTNDRSNLQGLCQRCHSIKTARVDGAFGR